MQAIKDAQSSWPNWMASAIKLPPEERPQFMARAALMGMITEPVGESASKKKHRATKKTHAKRRTTKLKRRKTSRGRASSFDEDFVGDAARRKKKRKSSKRKTRRAPKRRR